MTPELPYSAGHANQPETAEFILPLTDIIEGGRPGASEPLPLAGCGNNIRDTGVAPPTSGRIAPRQRPPARAEPRGASGRYSSRQKQPILLCRGVRDDALKRRTPTPSPRSLSAYFIPRHRQKARAVWIASELRCGRYGR